MTDTEEQKPVEVKKQEAQKPNRGMSKKEWRRVEALKQRLEPRIEKLETQINEHLEKINSLSDKREGENIAGKAEGDGLNEDKEVVKNTELAQDEVKKESPIGKIVSALQAAGLGEEPLRRENTDALQNGKERPRSAQQEEEIEEKGTAIEKLLVALKQVGLGSDPTALRLVADLAALNPNNRTKPRASHLIQPSGGRVPPAPDLRAEYEKRVNELRPGDIDGLMEVKREFRRRGLEIY
jgi:hypothetical protein